MQIAPMITRNKSTWCLPIAAKGCRLPINIKRNCTSPEEQCSPEETTQARQVFYSIGRGYSTIMQGWQDGHR
jgi:hypothetical protein